jgi:hypothetical protein
MNSGNSNLCDVQQIKNRYSVTWNKHIAGLSLYSDKVVILLDMIIRDSKSWEIGIQLSSGHVLWMSSTLLATLDTMLLTEYVQQVGQVKNHDQITGAVFDNMDDVDTFTKRLEQKYIWHVLKQ